MPDRKKLPDNVEIINNYNNYLPLTSQASKYVQDKGINKFYKEIGVNYNLYADTPPNSPVELITISSMTREFTEAQTKYIVTMVIKKILKFINLMVKLDEQPVPPEIVKSGVGFGKTETTCVILSLQPLAFVTNNLTVYVPADVYCFVGFIAELVNPSPKLQLYVLPPTEVLVNVKVFKAEHWILLLTLKDAVGFGEKVKVSAVLSLQPAKLVATKLIT